MKIGIIGGSGLDDKLEFKDVKSHKVHTPYGAPSSTLKIGRFGEVEVVAIARHGPGHSIMPSNVNFRANIWALREIGVTHVIATTACGSLREEIKPGHFVVIDQFIDRTSKRAQTFHEGSKVCHIQMSDPFCPVLRALIVKTVSDLGIVCHTRGTMVTIEGPRFSSRAESRMFRQWGGDVINMSTVPEVVLAREAELCYASIAMCTDYDSWHEELEAVTLDAVFKTMVSNVTNSHRLLAELLPRITDDDCSCRHALQNALI